MKVLVGVVLAGVVAAGVAVVSGGGGGPLGAAAPGKSKDPPPDQKYTMTPIVYGGAAKPLDGPAGLQAEGSSFTKGHDIDDAGNIYWTQCQETKLRGYLEETKRVVTLAGSAQGPLDGPLSRARFGGWGYNSTNLMSASADGRHVFVRDVYGGSVWRHVDLEAGTVSTLGQWHHFKGGCYIIARDRCGEVYAFCTSGADVPDCKGYKKLKIAPFKNGKGGTTRTWMPLDHCALDVEKMRFYWHGRNAPWVCDLKTGKVTAMTSTVGKDKLRKSGASGSFDAMRWYCPTGMGISPGGRYVYVGGGDHFTFFRLDLEKKYIHVYGRDPSGNTYSFQDGIPAGGKTKFCLGRWPAAGSFNNHGYGAWATAYGPLYKLTPVK